VTNIPAEIKPAHGSMMMRAGISITSPFLSAVVRLHRLVGGLV